ncbi:MAG: hypothetical protein WDZ88_00555 [Candidatus Paceibacterota bacterium]
MENQEKYKRAHARLTSLKENLDYPMIHEKYVSEYHQILNSLADTGIEIDEFKIPDSELKQSWASSNYMTGEVEYNDYKEIEKTFFLYKLDSLLNYLGNI